MLYIDTERKFSAGRLVEIATARAGGPYPNPGDTAPDPGDPAALAVRVLVASPASAAELLSMLQVRCCQACVLVQLGQRVREPTLDLEALRPWQRASPASATELLPALQVRCCRECASGVAEQCAGSLPQPWSPAALLRMC